MERPQIPLQLLACLDALIAEGSVTRAARRVGISQPGMSNALARLRRLTGDPLLVRTSRGMELTPRAVRMGEAVRRGLAAFDEVFADLEPFVPDTASGQITVTSVDFVGMLLLPEIIGAIEQQASRVSLDLRLPNPELIDQWLADGVVDIAVGYFPMLGPELRVSTLFVEPLVCIAARDHPNIRDVLSLQQFRSARHVLFGSPFEGVLSTLEQQVSARLAEIGVERSVGLTVASLVVIPYVVARSSMVATLPARLAHHFARMVPVQILPVPAGLQEVTISMVWHDRTQRSGLHAWFRELLRSTAPAFASGLSGPPVAAVGPLARTRRRPHA